MVKNYQLFLTFLKIGLVGYGGGSAALPIYHKEIIERNKWMSDDEFSDIIAIANTLPGPIQPKIVGYVGYRLKGIIGLIVSLLAIIVPTVIIMVLFLGTIYAYKDQEWISGMINAVLPVVAVMMGIMTWEFFTKSNKSLGPVSNIIFIFCSSVILVVLNIHPAFLILFLILIAFIPQGGKR